MSQAFAAAPRHVVPYLSDNSPESCPVPPEDLRRFVRARMGQVLRERQLAFVRTAQVEACRYWMWRYVSEGVACYALVMQDAEGTWMSCRRNEERLPPESVLLADYRDARPVAV